MSDSIKGMPLEAYHFDDDGNAVAGADGKERINPYVCFDLSEIKGIPDSGLVAWVLLLRQWKSTKKEWVTIPKRIREEAGVGRRKITRGLPVLETEGFVELRKSAGKSHRVRRKQG